MSKYIYYIFSLILFVSCNKGGSYSNQPPLNTGNIIPSTECPEDRIYSQELKRCIKICGNDQHYDSVSDSCVDNPVPVCYNDLVFDVKTKQCICPGKSIESKEYPTVCECLGPNIYFDRNIKDCVCDAGYLLSVKTGECVKDCKNGEVYDLANNDCIPDCSKEKKVYSRSYGKCIPVCNGEYKYDSDEDACVQICVGNSYRKRGEVNCRNGAALAVFEEDWSILPLLEESLKPSICIEVDGGMESIVTPSYLETRKNMIKNALNAWLGPLKVFKGKKFAQSFLFDVKINKDKDCIFEDKVFTLYFVNRDSYKYHCPQPSSACANPEDKLIYFSPEQKIDNEESTFIHEIGHLLGFDDSYEKNKNSPNYLNCKEGYTYSTTIMCGGVEKKTLAADIEGVQQRYCHFFDNLDRNACIQIQNKKNYSL